MVCLFAAIGLSAQQPNTPSEGSGNSPAASLNVPRLIKFSGALADVTGQPLAGPVDVTFSIYKSQSDAAPLRQEAQTVQADATGQYTVLLGAMSAQGLPMDLFTSGEARWLGVAAGNLPEQPRVLLVSVPYALKAGDAETLGGKPASAYLQAVQDPTGSGTTSAATTSTSGSSTQGATGKQATLTTATGIAPALLTGTQNYIPVLTDNSGSLGNSLLYQINGNVGVGTLAPAFPLHVFAAGISDIRSEAGSYAKHSWRVANGGTNQKAWQFYADSSSNALSLTALNDAENNETIAMQVQRGTGTGITSVVFPTGNVGIGTASPTATLEVNGTAKFDGAVTLGSTITGNVSTSNQLVSTVATGTAPLQVNSNTLVPNLNADRLDGLHASAFQPVGASATLGPNAFVGTQTITGDLSVSGTVNGVTITPSTTKSCTVNNQLATCLSANILAGYTDASSGGGSSLTSGGLGGRSLTSAVVGGNSITDGVVGGTISGGGGIVDTAGNLANYANTVTNHWGTVAGGRLNQAGDNTGPTSTNCCDSVGGGLWNSASGTAATVAGGLQNSVSAYSATVSGGAYNEATVYGATVAGGYDNHATGARSSVAGGLSNRASGNYSTVAGGSTNNAIGVYSFAAGCSANAANAGAFVWSGHSGTSCTTLTSSASGQFLALAPGGVVFYSNTAKTAGASLAAGGGSWSSVSDRNMKANFAPVNGQTLLARLNAIPMASWNYKTQPASIRHLGPMAQDFYAAFGLGEDDKHITTVDEGGVALAAIQALYRLSLRKDAQIRALKQQTEELKSHNRELAQRVEELSKV